jgi:hypothetical protein
MKKKRQVLFNDELIIHEFKKNSKIVESSKYGENKFNDFLEDSREFLLDLYDNIIFRIKYIKYKMSLI